MNYQQQNELNFPKISDNPYHKNPRYRTPKPSQGLKMRPIFLKITEIQRDRPGPNLKIADFWNSNSKISKKIKKNLEKICKKLDQILRILVEKKFQISTILSDKIQIE
jgi:hypothetical protein